MQAVSTMFPVHVASALARTLVVAAIVLALAVTALVVAAPRPVSTSGSAAFQAWLNYRAGERAGLISPEVIQAAWNEYRAGERGDR
jgi:hypothetical protein